MNMLAHRSLGATGLSLSVLGFGSAPLGGMPGADEALAQATLRVAAEAGITHFDTAPLYGSGVAEDRLGRWLATTRSPLVLSTKTGCRLAPKAPQEIGEATPVQARRVMFRDYSPAGLRASFDASIERLGGRRAEILLAHDPDKITSEPKELLALLTSANQELAALKAEGMVAAIGIGTNRTETLEIALDAGAWDCFLLAGRFTLLEQERIAPLLSQCQARGIGFVAAAPFNSGLLAGGSTWNYAPAPEPQIAKRDQLQALTARHGVPLIAAALQYPLRHPGVTSVLTGMRSPKEVEQNLAALRTPIDDALWQDLFDAGLIEIF